MPTTPDCTVLIPVHNGVNYLREAIDSALNQEAANVEVIVVDDASTDGTAELVHAYVDRVRYLRLSKQATSIAVTNAGLNLAQGEFVLILHHDDVLCPGKVAAHVSQMRAHPNVALSYSAQTYIGPGGERLGRLRSPVAHHDYVVPGSVELSHLVVQNYINFCNAVVRRSAYDRVGPFREELWCSAEWLMWTQIAMRWEVGYIDQELSRYRLHPAALTMTRTTDAGEYFEQLHTAWLEIWSDPMLPNGLAAQQPGSRANMYLSTALLSLVRGEWLDGCRATATALSAVPPWRLPSLVRSSALLARTVPRLRLVRGERKRRSSGRR